MNNSVGALTFAIGAKYQRMAAIQARSWERLGIPMTVVIDGNLIAELGRTHAQVVFLPPNRSVEVPFGFEALAYELSPYDLTFKTDADLVMPPTWKVPSYISASDLFTGQPHTVYGQPVVSSPYRRNWLELGVPEVHSAFFAFRKSPTAELFFDKVEEAFHNFYASPLARVDTRPSTDLVYSVAWPPVMGYSLGMTLPFVHMKPMTSGLNHSREDWTNEMSFLTSGYGLYVQGIEIIYPFHYYDKAFVSTPGAQCLFG